MKSRTISGAIVATMVLMHASVFGEENAGSQVLLKALPAATVSLQEGLDASAAKGKPISGKFEMEDGKLQLSVYTEKAGKYAEIIVDFSSGKVQKVAPITQGEDLAHAKAQASALAMTKSSLKAVADKIEQATPCTRVVRIAPAVTGHKPVANIVLAKGDEIMTVVAPLN